MRILLILLAFSTAQAQEEPGPPDAAPPPPLPPVDADFSADRDSFSDEVKTEPEEDILDDLEAGRRRFEQGRPLYVRYPGLARVSEAASGLFGAGLVGLVGGSIGEAIDPGDENEPLGGASGRAFGLLGASWVGSTMGVWGASLLFEKPVTPLWSALGSGVGTVVGGGAATGILFALEDDPETAGGLAVGTLFLFQVAGAMLFTELGTPERDVLSPDSLTDPGHKERKPEE